LKRLDLKERPVPAVKAAGHFAESCCPDYFDQYLMECSLNRYNQSCYQNCSHHSFLFGKARSPGFAVLSFGPAKRRHLPALLSVLTSWRVPSIPTLALSPYRTRDLCSDANNHTSAPAAWRLNETSHHCSAGHIPQHLLNRRPQPPGRCRSHLSPSSA